MGTAADSEKAREALLAAAREAFSEHGYERATVRDICRRAGLNVASINYHFGTKQELYAEVLRTGVQPPVPDEEAMIGEPEAALRSFLRFLLVDSLEHPPELAMARLMAAEMVNPTPALDSLVRDVIRPHFSRLRNVVAYLLGPVGTEETIDQFAFSVLSQAAFYRHSRPMVERLSGRKYGPAELERAAEHILDTVLAGIEQLRARRDDALREAAGGTT